MSPPKPTGGATDSSADVESLVTGQFPLGDTPSGASATPAASTPAEVAAEAPDVQIGPYKLLQKLGEGGMGTVWVAEQTEPVRRRVALKVIKPGMDSHEVLRRFAAERQALGLALMDHTNIARVLDAGTTESSLPYFVMELVKGLPRRAAIPT